LSSKESRLGEKQLVQVAMFHHVYDHEESDFREFLLWFSKHYHVVSYTEATQRICNGDIDRPYGAITFDDGLKSIVPAARIMSELGLPGCFFVCPGIIGETNPDALRKFCVQTRMDYESDEFANWDELEQIKSAGHEIGSHTVNHPEMNQLDPEQVIEELHQSRELISARLGDAEHFAWPYGEYDFFGEDAAAQVVKAGYQSCASGVRGAHGPHQLSATNFGCVRRDNLEANWPLRHIRHFFLSNADSPVNPQHWWPQSWRTPIAS
jgi:peptidoglycan/xylan/chitin deacetylase (PgdA/CDA1 family)